MLEQHLLCQDVMSEYQILATKNFSFPKLGSKRRKKKSFQKPKINHQTISLGYGNRE